MGSFSNVYEIYLSNVESDFNEHWFHPMCLSEEASEDLLLQQRNVRQSIETALWGVTNDARKLERSLQKLWRSQLNETDNFKLKYYLNI